MKIGKKTEDDVRAEGGGVIAEATQAEAQTNEAAQKNAELTQKIAELTNDLQRTRADFENYRKQVEMQKENERKTARMTTVYKMLTVLDDLDRAFASYAELEPLKKSLDKSLKELGLAKIATDGEFDPDLHEAVQASGEGEKETIAEVLRPGYYYEGEVLRPAMVRVERK